MAQPLLELLLAIALRRPRSHGVQEFPLVGPTIALLLSHNADRLRAQTRLVKGLAPNALRIATALANDERPYSVVHHPTEASRALRAMLDAGVRSRDKGSSWSLCDPVFVLWLQQPQAGRLQSSRRGAGPMPRWAQTT